MNEPTYLLMQETEMEIFHAATKIYAAMIQSNLVSASDKKEAMKIAIQDAIDLAELTDKMITAPDEHVEGKRRSSEENRTFGLSHGLK